MGTPQYIRDRILHVSPHLTLCIKLFFFFSIFATTFPLPPSSLSPSPQPAWLILPVGVCGVYSYPSLITFNLCKHAYKHTHTWLKLTLMFSKMALFTCHHTMHSPCRYTPRPMVSTASLCSTGCNSSAVFLLMDICVVPSLPLRNYH